MKPAKTNGQTLGILKEIHRAKVQDIKDTYDQKHKGKKKQAEKEIAGHREIQELQKQRDELEKQKDEIGERIDELTQAIYEKDDITECSWDYKDQLLKQEQERYERELNALLNRQGRGDE